MNVRNEETANNKSVPQKKNMNLTRETSGCCYPLVFHVQHQHASVCWKEQQYCKKLKYKKKKKNKSGNFVIK